MSNAYYFAPVLLQHPVFLLLPMSGVSMQAIYAKSKTQPAEIINENGITWSDSTFVIRKKNDI